MIASTPAGPRSPADDRRLADDRRRLSPTLQAAIVVSTAASVGLAARMLPTAGRDPNLAFAGGVVAGALAVAALRSVSIRATSRWMCVVATLLILRFGSLSADLGGTSVLVIVWILVTAAALVLGSQADRSRFRAALPRADAPERAAGPSPASGRSPVAGKLSSRSIRIIVVIGCLAAAAGIGVGPAVSSSFSSGPSSGSAPRASRSSSGALTPSDRLDMAQRPRLGDDVVMTVATDSPGFWRSQTFDVWDGQAWTRSTSRLRPIAATGAVTPDPTDVVPAATTEVRDEFRILAPFALALPVATRPVSVSAATQLYQWTDGSVVSADPLGSGATYSVVSARPSGLTESRLRAAGRDAPAAVSRQYARPPVATARVRQLASTITANATTSYDKVVAIEHWLADHTTYSLDAPITPSGADVVDDFIFESKVGWCEQIASTLTVLLRLTDVPARVATGYVPEGRDPVTQRYPVRARDAHAWTEVWFAGVGWVPFDPTADVPLSGTAASSSWADDVARYGSWVLIAAAVVAAFGAAVVRLVAGGAASLRRIAGAWWARRRSGSLADGWPDAMDSRLDRVGVGCGRARAPSETTTVYARALADRLGDDRLPMVGTTIDRARFAAGPVDEASRTEVASILESLSR